MRLSCAVAYAAYAVSVTRTAHTGTCCAVAVVVIVIAAAVAIIVVIVVIVAVSVVVVIISALRALVSVLIICCCAALKLIFISLLGKVYGHCKGCLGFFLIALKLELAATENIRIFVSSILI